MEKIGKKELIILINATSPSIDDCEKLIDEGLMDRAGKDGQDYKWLKAPLQELTEKKLWEIYNRY